VLTAVVSITLDQGITIGVLITGIGWLARYVFIPWRNNVIERDKKIAADNEEFLKRRIKDMERYGRERQQIIQFMDNTTEALKTIGTALRDIEEKCIEPNDTSS